jgi:hypothetical protein
VATNQKRNQPDELLRARIEGRTYTQEQLADRATQLEAKMILLKNRYEQFFLGIDRKPPSNDRDSLHKELEMLRQISTKNTALKFKLNSLFNRFLSYERLWMRTETDIEEGRYRRDLVRLRRHRNAGLPSAEDVDMSDFEAEARPSPRPPPPNPNPALAAGLNDDRLREIFESYVQAKKECNEPTEGLTFDHVAKRIRDQVPELVKQANGRRIDFKVAIKDGKAVLRAVAGD